MDYIFDQQKINTKFLVLNNNGGQIFQKLDISKLIFLILKIWITPLNIDLKNIALLYGLEYAMANNFNDLLLIINNKYDKPLIIDYKIDVNTSKGRKEKLIKLINKVID